MDIISLTKHSLKIKEKTDKNSYSLQQRVSISTAHSEYVASQVTNLFDGQNLILWSKTQQVNFLSL